MKKTVIACLLGILAWNVWPAAAQTQGWRVWYDMDRSSELVNLLPSPDGGLLLVSDFRSRDESLSDFVYFLGNGICLSHIRPDGNFDSFAIPGEPTALGWNRETGRLFSFSNAEEQCGMPAHHYHFNLHSSARQRPERRSIYYHSNFLEEYDGEGAWQDAYYPHVEEVSLWPRATAEAVGYLPHPNGRFYASLFDELLIDNWVNSQANWPHFRSLRVLRTSLIFDVEAWGDSSLLLATSSGLIRTDLEGNIRDTLMAGTLVRRIEQLPAGWLLEAREELLLLDNNLNEQARITPQAEGHMLRHWAISDTEAAVLTAGTSENRLTRYDFDLNWISRETLPESLANPLFVAYREGQPVLAGKWSLPVAAGFSIQRSFSWFAWRDAANVPEIDLALVELKAERVERRELDRDFAFDLMARIENRSGIAVESLGARFNRVDYMSGSPAWLSLHLPEAIPAGGSAWVRIERLSASYSGPTPDALSASVCLQIDLGNGQPDPQPADNARCQDLRLQYTSAAGRLHAEPLRLQPNPTSGRFRLTGLADNVRDFWLTDACGRTVRAEPSARFAGGCEFVLESLPAGVYQLRAGSAEKPLRLVLID